MAQRPRGEIQWPPRSPHDALLSTPGGRERLRRLENRLSPSPSPIRRSKSTPMLGKGMGLGGTYENEEEEDEEMLELQLQELQTKLKLKRLREEKARSARIASVEHEEEKSGNRPLSRAASAAGRRPGIQELIEQRAERSRSQASVHVPASPIKRVKAPETQTSPTRVLLGIDKGRRAADVSLGRAPNLRKTSDKSMIDAQRAGSYLQRASSQNGVHGPISRTTAHMEETPRTTFSERMADQRTQDAEQLEKNARIKQTRSNAFDIDPQEMQRFKVEAEELPQSRSRPPEEFSREQVMASFDHTNGTTSTRTKATSSDLKVKNEMPSIGGVTEGKCESGLAKSRPFSRTGPTRASSNDPIDSSEFESFSSLHLSRRIIPHTILSRTLSGKKIFSIPDLLQAVVAPYFRLPEVENDVVLFGIVASKSEPKTHKTKGTRDKQGKYMALTLTDLRWELELFLFDSAFDKFWKIQPGCVLAILNPGVMPPLKQDTGRFSLTLNSSDDTVLEVGTARDLGFCKSVKKDGTTCDSWIDSRHTENCEFHVNEVLKKTKASRMEVNTMNFGGGGRGRGGGMFGGNRSRVASSRSSHWSGWDGSTKEPPERNPSQYDRESQTQLYISEARSAASRLDDPYVDPDAFHRGSKEERMRKQLATKQREKELRKALGSRAAHGQGGLGAVYMNSRKSPPQDADGISDDFSNKALEPPPDATSLGLLRKTASDMKLSPLKRKRAVTGSGVAGDNGMGKNTTAMGWGENLTKQLGKMREGQSFLPPVKKKTRFVTERGIKEAGRESLGGEMAGSVEKEDSSDDGLVII